MRGSRGNRCAGNWLQEVMTENKKGHKVGIWKDNNSENKTDWAIYRAIKLHHAIKLNNPWQDLWGGNGQPSSSGQVSDGSSQLLGPSLVLEHTADSGLCSQGWPCSTKKKLDCVAPCLLRKVRTGEAYFRKIFVKMVARGSGKLMQTWIQTQLHPNQATEVCKLTPLSLSFLIGTMRIARATSQNCWGASIT